MCTKAVNLQFVSSAPPFQVLTEEEKAKVDADVAAWRRDFRKLLFEMQGYPVPFSTPSQPAPYITGEFV